MPVYDHTRQTGDVHVFRLLSLTVTVLPPVWRSEGQTITLVAIVEGGTYYDSLAYNHPVGGEVLGDTIERRCGRTVPAAMADDIAAVVNAQRRSQ